MVVATRYRGKHGGSTVVEFTDERTVLAARCGGNPSARVALGAPG